MKVPRKFASGLVKFPTYLRAYKTECDRTRLQYSNQAIQGRFLREFPRWYYLLFSGSSPIDSEIPWITIGAEKYLADYTTKEVKVFEYGCGGSTLYFAKKASHVVSVEHDPVWAEMVRKKLIQKQLGHLVDLRVYEPGAPGTAPKDDPADPDLYTSSDFPNRSFSNY